MSWLDDVRDSVAVTLMGWVSKLATKHYRTQLAAYITIGMTPPAQEACCVDDDCCGGRNGWSTITR